MSKLVSARMIKRAIALLSFGLAVALYSNGVLSSPLAPTLSQELPEGKGAEAVRAKCLSCHEADLIAQQRLARAAWLRELDKMIRWGADVSGEEKELMLEYLAKNFSPLPASGPVSQEPGSVSSGDRGLVIFEEKCLFCHEADLVEQQRLTRPGWVREVDKMVRWGAVVNESEKESLIDYLSKNFGPRR